MLEHDLLPWLAVSLVVFVIYKYSERVDTYNYSQAQQKIIKPSRTTLTEYKSENGRFHIPQRETKLPPFFDKLSDLFDESNTKYIPFCWQFDQIGAEVVKSTMAKCLKLILACDGNGELHDLEDEIRIVRTSLGQVLNVDLSTVDGIRRSKKMGIVESGLPDVIVSNHFIEAISLFGQNIRGKLFIIFDDPVDRIISTFYNGPDQNLSIEDIREFMDDERVQSNFIVRSMVDKKKGYLDEQDLEAAKDILRRKCIIGLTNKRDESMERFQAYFGWKHVLEDQCKDKLLTLGTIDPIFEVGSSAYNILMAKNMYDLELYRYAVFLFKQQGIALNFKKRDRHE